ncbi:MAG TPA: TetR/AcrR family transcriptional regulator [Candidatus Acidoferrum sp.]|jgi:AcrR family transcriptional regulator|nr:TetR/AcrR family transcriptional regulator [Candidatus Acidoferrum sp.]
MALSSKFTRSGKPDPSSPPSRRERRSAEIRERLFHSALTLFGKKGFAETTIEDITEAADVGKGTFFNYFPSKDHILLAFGEMQLGKLEAAVGEARRSNEPMSRFLRALGVHMTEEPTRNPEIIRALLQAYLSTTPVREAMLSLQTRMLALHTELIRLGQEQGEIRKDVPAEEMAYVFRQTIFGTLLIWSLYGDATLHTRIEAAFSLLWTGMAPRSEVTMSTATAFPVRGD